MRVLVGIFCLVLAAGCSEKQHKPIPKAQTTSVDEQIQPEMSKSLEKYSQSLAQQMGLKIGNTFAQTHTQARKYFVPSKEDQKQAVFSVRSQPHENPKTNVTVYFRDNLADDKVKTMELKTIFSITKTGDMELTDYGMRLKCRHGENSTQWTVKSCL